MEARSIPIYWGSPDVARDFNPRSFINVSDFPSVDHAIAHVVRVDNDPALYRSMLEEPYFHENRPSPAFDHEALCDFFAKIAADSRPPAGTRGLRRFLKNWNRWGAGEAEQNLRRRGSPLENEKGALLSRGALFSVPDRYWPGSAAATGVPPISEGGD